MIQYSRILLMVAFLLLPLMFMAQSMSYTDFGLLISRSYNKGTARYQALSNSMQAVGGDISSSLDNPAGLAVLQQGSIGVTSSWNRVATRTTYYDNHMNNEHSNGMIENAHYTDIRHFNGANLTKIGFSIYYQKNNLFDNAFWTLGSNANNFATFTKYPDDKVTVYDHAIQQKINEHRRGFTRDLGVIFSVKYKRKLYLGFRLGSNYGFFNQNITLKEKNTDSTKSHTLEARLSQRLEEVLSGFSFGFGFIYKPFHHFRVGLSYRTPIWYNVQESSNIIEDNDGGSLRLKLSKFDTQYDGKDEDQSFEYRLKTPSTTHVSVAYVLGKRGFVNVDYQITNYGNIHLNSDTDDFVSEQRYFSNHLKDWAGSFGIGIEVRDQALSFRGGFRYYELPYKKQIEGESSPWQWSVGLGYSYRNVRVDLALVNRTSNSIYDYYANYSKIEPVKKNTVRRSLVLGINFLFD